MEKLISELQPTDVLFGRGSGPNDHEGNVRFRHYVAERKVHYMATNHRLTKTKIAREIVDLVHGSNGRFLKKVEASELVDLGLPEGSEFYELVDDDTIMEKAKQALRQNATKGRGEMEGTPLETSTNATSQATRVSVASYEPTYHQQLQQQQQHQQTYARMEAANSMASISILDLEPLPLMNNNSSTSIPYGITSSGSLVMNTSTLGSLGNMPPPHHHHHANSASLGSNNNNTPATSLSMSSNSGSSLAVNSGYVGSLGMNNSNAMGSRVHMNNTNNHPSSGGGPPHIHNTSPGTDVTNPFLMPIPSMSVSPQQRQTSHDFGPSLSGFMFEQQQQQQLEQFQMQHLVQQQHQQQQQQQQASYVPASLQQFQQMQPPPQQQQHMVHFQEQMPQRTSMSTRRGVRGSQFNAAAEISTANSSDDDAFDSLRASMTMSDLMKIHMRDHNRQQKMQQQNRSVGNTGNTVDELMDSFSQMKTGTSQDLEHRRMNQSSETMGTIEHIGSVTDMSMGTMGSSIFSTYRGGDSLAILAENEPLNDPLDMTPSGSASNQTSPATGVTPNGSRQTKNAQTNPSESTTSLSFAEALFDTNLRKSSSLSASINGILSDVRRQVESEYASGDSLSVVPRTVGIMAQEGSELGLGESDFSIFKSAFTNTEDDDDERGGSDDEK